MRAFRYARDAHKDKAEINRLRNSDPLTGLGNRRSFYRSIMQLISQVQEGKLQIALLTVDLDGFSKFNGQCGPKAADEVVIQLRDRLLSAAPDAQSIHRLGNDEFAITLTCAPDENLHERTRQQLKSPAAANQYAFPCRQPQCHPARQHRCRLLPAGCYSRAGRADPSHGHGTSCKPSRNIPAPTASTIQRLISSMQAAVSWSRNSPLPCAPTSLSCSFNHKST